MARKPSIILTPADKKSAAKDLRAELRDAKMELKARRAEIKAMLNVEETQAKLVADLEARIEGMK